MCARAPARGNVRFDKSRQSFRETHRRRGITSPPKQTICPASHTTMKRGKSFSGSHGHWGTCASGQVGGRHLSDQELPFDTHSGDNKGETRGKGHTGSGQRPEPCRTVVERADSKEGEGEEVDRQKNPSQHKVVRDLKKGDRWDSNPRHSEPQSDALTN